MEIFIGCLGSYQLIENCGPCCTLISRKDSPILR
jgi:hypothetical protein